jgi:hypothetical protein
MIPEGYMPSALICPQTAPTRTLLHNLLPWLEPVLLLEPGQAASPGCDASLLGAGAVELIPALGGAVEPSQAQAELTGLLHQWEDWIAVQRGAGKLEAIKAGVAPQPPKKETVRSLMDEIKAPQPDSGQEVSLPSHPPELIMHLAHIRGLLAQDVEGVYSQLDQGRNKLRQSLGLDLDEDQGGELAAMLPEDGPPIDYRLMEEGDLEPRLQAWAQLLPVERAQGAVLASEGREVAGVVGGRLKALDQSGKLPRSKAGASQFEPYYISWPPRAASLALPDLGVLEPAALLQHLESMKQAGTLAALREGLALVLQRAADEPFSATLAGELGDKCQELAGLARQGLPAASRQVALNLLLLPGLDLAGALALMQGHTPEIKPGGCLPLLTLELV